MTDPGDDPVERVNLLRRLDLVGDALAHRALDPTVRSIDGRPLTEREADILLSCTLADLQAASESNRAEEAVVRDRTALLLTLAELIKPHAGPAGGSLDEILARMPVAERREARRVLNQLTALGWTEP